MRALAVPGATSGETPGGISGERTEREQDLRIAVARIERVLADLAREIALLRRELGARPLAVRSLGGHEPEENDRSKVPTLRARPVHAPERTRSTTDA